MPNIGWHILPQDISVNITQNPGAVTVLILLMKALIRDWWSSHEARKFGGYTQFLELQLQCVFSSNTWSFQVISRCPSTFLDRHLISCNTTFIQPCICWLSSAQLQHTKDTFVCASLISIHMRADLIISFVEQYPLVDFCLVIHLLLASTKFHLVSYAWKFYLHRL